MREGQRDVNQKGDDGGAASREEGKEDKGGGIREPKRQRQKGPGRGWLGGESPGAVKGRK